MMGKGFWLWTKLRRWIGGQHPDNQMGEIDMEKALKEVDEIMPYYGPSTQLLILQMAGGLSNLKRDMAKARAEYEEKSRTAYAGYLEEVEKQRKKRKREILKLLE